MAGFASPLGVLLLAMACMSVLPTSTGVRKVLISSENPEDDSRRVLLIKGFTYGIPDDKYTEALEKASELIESRQITTVGWDGDKKTYPNPETNITTSSFSRLIEMIQETHPELEFVYFKKEGNGRGLISGGEVSGDKFGNFLGPFPFLTQENTNIIHSEDELPERIHGHNLCVEFSNIEKWYALGLEGMKWIKEKIGLSEIDVLVLGVGGVVSKEHEKMSEKPELYPKRHITEVEVLRE